MILDNRFFLAREIYFQLDNISWPKNAQEPDYVASLVKELPKILTEAMNGVYGKKIKTGGCFIHQKPIVHFINKPGFKDPELGDLLIICREKRYSGYVYNAIILQAKRVANPNHVYIPNDHQYVLYSEWPEFEYKRAGYLNGKTRSILPKTITQGAQYLLIEGHEAVELLTATVDRPLQASNCFAGTLTSLMLFESGRTFQISNPHDDWSQMILDLLRMSVSSYYTRKGIGHTGIRRWNGDASFDFICNLDNQQYAEDETEHELYDNDNARSGMSLICVDLGESFLERQD